MSEGERIASIPPWRVIACLCLVLQIVILTSLTSALQEESWFVGTVSATVEEGPLMLEGVSVNVTIDMQEDQDDLSIDFFGPLRLNHWQEERDSRATLSMQEGKEYDERVNETFDSPSPSAIKSMTLTLIQTGIGLSVLLLVLVCGDLWKQRSRLWLTATRRLVSLGSIVNTLMVLILILLVLPASWLGTIAENPKDLADSDENEAFLAHAEFSTDSSLGVNGFTLEFEASGYDIGMIRPANRSAVEAEPPASGTEDAESFILVAGEMRTETPNYLVQMIYYWFAIWVILPFVLLIQQRVAIDSRLAPINVRK